VHVELFAEELLDRLDQARVSTQDAEGLVVGVGSEGGARSAALFTPDFLPVGKVNIFRFETKNLDFFRRKVVRQEDIALFFEVCELFRCSGIPSFFTSGCLRMTC